MLRRPLPPRPRTTVRYSTVLALAFLMVAASAAPAFAQANPEPPSSWGVFVNFAPSWKGSTFTDIFLFDGEGTVEGSDFSIGLARGKALGGHWGVGYTRKKYKDGTTLVNSESYSEANFSNTSTETLVFHNVYLDAIEFFSFIPFATFKERVQVGLNVGGGAGFPKGTIDSTYVNVSTFTPPNGPPQTQTQTDIESGPAKDYIFGIQPLFRLEIVGAVIAAKGLKVTFGAGLNAPSTFAFSVGAVYLIGAK
jgi:hypothetical protein